MPIYSRSEVLRLMNYCGDMFLGLINSSGLEANPARPIRYPVTMSEPSRVDGMVTMHNVSEVKFNWEFERFVVKTLGFYTSEYNGDLILGVSLDRGLVIDTGDDLIFREGSLLASIESEFWVDAESTHKQGVDVILTGRHVRVRNHGTEKDKTKAQTPVYARRVRTMGRR